MNKKTKIQFMICFLLPLAVVIEEIIKIMNNQNKSVLTYIFIIVYINLAIGILFSIIIINIYTYHKTRKSNVLSISI